MMKLIVPSLLLLALLGCSDSRSAPTATQAADGSTQEAGAAEHSLVFFLDPNGGPCRMQDSILNSMTDELTGRVNLAYVMTTEPNDRQYFYTYGIRGLPSLVLVDTDGKEIRRLSPGVKQAAEVRELLQAIPNRVL